MAYQGLDADGIVSAHRGRGTVVLPLQPLHFAHEEPKLPSFTFGVLTPSLNPFYTPFVLGVEEVAREAQLLLFLCHTHDDTWFARRSLQQLIAKQVKGLILASTRVLIGDEMSGKRNRRRLLPPIVYVDEPDAQDHVVLLDGEGAGYRATIHLIKHGHSRIGLVIGPIAWSNVNECYQGYKRALASAGISADPELIVEEPLFTIECGYQGMPHLLELKDPPTAVFAAGDIFAIGAMQAIKGRGQHVPQDVAIVGYNNIELASLVEPALTTTNAPTYQMGVDAQMIYRLLEREDTTTRNRSLELRRLSPR